jgi:hypothetical protein
MRQAADRSPQTRAGSGRLRTTRARHQAGKT